MNINQFPWEVYPGLREVIYEEYDANSLIYPSATVTPSGTQTSRPAVRYRRNRPI